MSLTTGDFEFVSTLVHRQAAIVLEPGKEYLVEARLRGLARTAGLASVSEFVTSVRQRSCAASEARIVDAMTTNETSWFRDGDPFTALSSLALPPALARGGQGTLRAWSAACSTGQEAYSLAMVLVDALPAGWDFEILGTDISAAMVERADAGTFSELEMKRGLPDLMRARHFTRAGSDWQVSDELRRRITFTTLNLSAPFPRLPTFDLVFMRNVLIYFDAETKRSVLGRVRRVMRPDGWLFLGGAETTLGIREDFERATAGRSSAYRPRT